MTHRFEDAEACVAEAITRYNEMRAGGPAVDPGTVTNLAELTVGHLRGHGYAVLDPGELTEDHAIVRRDDLRRLVAVWRSVIAWRESEAHEDTILALADLSYTVESDLRGLIDAVLGEGTDGD